jgi:hypothetical protein
VGGGEMAMIGLHNLPPSFSLWMGLEKSK